MPSISSARKKIAPLVGSNGMRTVVPAGGGVAGFAGAAPGGGRSAGGVSSPAGFSVGAGSDAGSVSSAHAATGSAANASASA